MSNERLKELREMLYEEEKKEEEMLKRDFLFLNRELTRDFLFLKRLVGEIPDDRVLQFKNPGSINGKRRARTMLIVKEGSIKGIRIIDTGQEELDDTLFPNVEEILYSIGFEGIKNIVSFINRLDTGMTVFPISDVDGPLLKENFSEYL